VKAKAGPKSSVYVTNGDEMGRNWISAFICNTGSWGHMGRKRVSPLEMGTGGGGRVSSNLRFSLVQQRGEQREQIHWRH
jgi:hypothetical protein